MELKHKRVLVMGLGLHGGGLGVTRWLIRQGARVKVTDLKTASELEPTLRQLADAPIEFVLGEHRADDFKNADLVIRNPGVPRESPYLQLARENGIPVRMELGLFLERLPRGAAQVIGITGTKGKTTTTLMTGAILQKVNPKTVVAGNLRVSALEMLDAIDAETPVVLEMSSFQLEEFEELRVSPHIAALTNLYPDHLNRYRDMDDYARAKAQIFLHQAPRDVCVLNLDNPLSTRLRSQVMGRVVWFSRLRALNDGAWVEGGWLVWSDHRKPTRVLPVADLIPGVHNIENALAALAIARAWGAPFELIAAALREFKGVPHRLELVRTLDGVQYINDTTATSPQATIAALRTLARRGMTIYLIAGGSDKGLPYAELAQVIREVQARVILLDGSATDKIERALHAAGAAELIVGRTASLGQAVHLGRARAQVGDIVLLSPGAASFGLFVNEFDRGEQFRELVRAL